MILIAVTLRLGTEGKTGMIPLASTWNDFKAGRTDKFAVEALDVGKVLMIRLHLSENCWIKNSDWFVERIIVTSSTQKKAFLFPCHRWVESDMVIFHGKGIVKCTYNNIIFCMIYLRIWLFRRTMIKYFRK